MKKCIVFIMVSILAFSSCKKNEFPSTPTIVTGKVVDENDKPIEGYKFVFDGFNRTGVLKGFPTYTEYKKTDKNGVYHFSWVISEYTDEITFKPIGIELPNGIIDNRYVIYSFKNGKLDFPEISPIKYGVTNTFNYIVKFQN